MIDLHEGVLSIFAEANGPRAPRDEDEVRRDNWGSYWLSLRGEDDALRRWEKTLRVKYAITPIPLVGTTWCPRCGGLIEIRLGCDVGIHVNKTGCGNVSLKVAR
jgi:hypothetical protein